MRNRKIKKYSYLCMTILCILMTGCSSQTKEGSKTTDTGKTGENETDKIISIETEEYIQNAIDKANLIADDCYMQTAEGEIFCTDTTEAYSYYGQDIRLVRASAASVVVAVMNDGSMYCNNTLVTNEYKIKDVLWQTNNVNIDAYLITEDGQVLRYDNNYNGSGYNYLTELGSYGNIVVGCRWRGANAIFLDKEGNAYGMTTSKWDGCEIKGWKNAVVMACTRNEDDGTNSIAAIAGDGTVYATGDYSEEILSWGELAYITMDEQLIVGLKKDGTLAFAGTQADKFKETSLTGVEAVRAFDERLVVSTNDGFYIAYIPSFDGDFTFLSTEKTDASNESYLYVDTSGVIKTVEEGNWMKTPYPNAVKGEAERLILFRELSADSFQWGDYEYETENFKFMMLDVNGDGAQEILVENPKIGSRIENLRQIYSVYNGEIMCMCGNSGFEKYYPEAEVIVSTSLYDGYDQKVYLKFDGCDTVGILYEIQDLNQTSEPITYKKRMDGEITEISKEEFDEMLKEYVGDEEAVEIDVTKMVDNTKENRISHILEGICGEEEKEISDKNAAELVNPVAISKRMVTWDSIYFGNYWQDDTNGDGVVDTNDSKTPIRWMVLSCDGQNALLLAENILMFDNYSGWETGFLADAFTAGEQAIMGTYNDSGSKVSSLKKSDVENTDYGFTSYLCRTTTPTKYALENGPDKSDEWLIGSWWLGTTGTENYYYAGGRKRGVKDICYAISKDGDNDATGDLTDVLGVRPAVYVNLSDSGLWDYAGTISSEDYIEYEYK